ncbi:MAG: FTR1 family iron permease [Propionibacteriaceae bacterium]|jgi:high-affinity iron transporter|nr:FTR1 family iron permease [Propionibacteriaceae bacterium]
MLGKPTLAVGAIRAVVIGIIAFLALLLGASTAHAESQTWGEVAEEMAAVLKGADESYRQGDTEAAKDGVNNAYYGYYEKIGFEKTVMAYISGDRAAEVEYQFSTIKKQMSSGAPQAEVTAALDALAEMLRVDAEVLDGNKSDPLSEFLGSLTIILREGFEAILVVGAIIAYLVKSGNASNNRYVYIGVGVALLASIALAWVFSSLSALAGAYQEIFEGATMLIAVAMLIWVSNWMMSKADSQAWSAYIKERSSQAIETGNIWTLSFVAFLAVFREGAETIIFYQALFARASTNQTEIWLGLGVGLVALAIVYAAIRLLSIRIPLKPFFLATSALLALMAVTFAGGGIKELQEGDLVSTTTVPGISSLDLLGFYPTVETIAAQALAIILVIVLTVLGLRKSRRLAQPQPQGGK